MSEEQARYEKAVKSQLSRIHAKQNKLKEETLDNEILYQKIKNRRLLASLGENNGNK